MQHKHLQKKGLIGEDVDENFCGLNHDEFTALDRQKKRDATIKDRKERMRPECCAHENPDSFGDCDSMGWPKGPAMGAMLVYG